MRPVCAAWAGRLGTRRQDLFASDLASPAPIRLDVSPVTSTYPAKTARPTVIFGPDVSVPVEPLATIWRHRKLVTRFARNDAIGRYRGSALGLTWSFLNPLLMLGVFTIVFSTVFRGARFGGDGLPDRPAVLLIFCGMTVFGVFTEVLTRAPTMILAHPNYVKKVVFPLEILPLALVGSALFHATVGLLILAVGTILLGQPLSWTVLLLPLVLIPLAFFSAGIGWFFASLGVFARDLGHVVGVISQALFFLTPVVFPFQAILDNAPLVASILEWNPLKIAVDEARMVLVWGQLPNFMSLGVFFVLSVLTAWFGFAWFQKTRRGFADVL